MNVTPDDPQIAMNFLDESSAEEKIILLPGEASPCEANKYVYV